MNPAHMGFKMPRSQQNCGNCDAFVPNEKTNGKQGACVAEPPSVLPGYAPAPGSSLMNPGGQQQMQTVLQGVWPPTDSGRWCRQWRPIDDDRHDTN